MAPGSARAADAGGGAMKALTLTQPWAALVALGEKRYETRSWSTPYRGPLAIHAAKGFPAWARDTMLEEPFREALVRHYGAGGPPPWIMERLDAQRGHVIATCRLTDCVRMTERMLGELRAGFLIERAEHELEFGDWSEGRYAWRLENVRLLAAPVPARGALGLWEWAA